MKIEASQLRTLATALEAERKRQRLSREEAASVCGVSASFIRDAESNPENCSLGKLVKLIGGLGLSLNVAGLSHEQEAKTAQLKKTRVALSSRTKSNKQPDFGVPDEQVVHSRSVRQTMGASLASSNKGAQS